jgi:hypothetical protein
LVGLLELGKLLEFVGLLELLESERVACVSWVLSFIMLGHSNDLDDVCGMCYKNGPVLSVQAK